MIKRNKEELVSMDKFVEEAKEFAEKENDNWVYVLMDMVEWTTRKMVLKEREKEEAKK